MDFAASRTFTRLEARITQEEGDFTVSVQMRNGENHSETAWGIEKAASIEMASGMLAKLAAQFCISQEFIKIRIVMNNHRDGTLH